MGQGAGVKSEGVRIGVDIGGTFTDLQILDARTGALNSLKTPTTPEDPSIGLMAGIEAAAGRFGFALADIGLLLHGTTIATNAVLERKLARGVLLTTAGFEDVLEIGRHVRRDIYGLKPNREPALIPRDRRLGVPERIRADGSVERAARGGRRSRLPSRRSALWRPRRWRSACCNANVNPAHERALRRRHPARAAGLPVSHLLARSAPRSANTSAASTTVLNALLMPVVRSYLDRAQGSRMAEGGFQPRLLLVQSNGGVCSPRPRRAAGAAAAVRPERRSARGAARLRQRSAGRTWSASTWAAPASTSPSCRMAQSTLDDAGRDRRPAGAPADGRDPHHRRRRRLDRLGRRRAGGSSSARAAPARVRARSAMAAAARSRR